MTRQANLCVDQVAEAYLRIGRTRARYSVRRVLNGCRMEGPVDEANGLTGLFANVINIKIPRQFSLGSRLKRPKIMNLE